MPAGGAPPRRGPAVNDPADRHFGGERVALVVDSAPRRGKLSGAAIAIPCLLAGRVASNTRQGKRAPSEPAICGHPYGVAEFATPAIEVRAGAQTSSQRLSACWRVSMLAGIENVDGIRQPDYKASE